MESSTSSRKTFSYRRLSKSCSRCKKRKTKCDLNFPTCTPCKKAGTVCRGYSSVDETEVPRSLVRALEDQVAQLESQVEKFRQAPSNLPDIFTSKIAKATLSIGVTSSRSFFQSTISSALLLHPSCPPLPVARSKTQSRQARTRTAQSPVGQTGTSRISSTNLKSVPFAAIEHMVHNYTDIHLPQSPVIIASWLHKILNSVLAEKEGDTDQVLAQGISSESGLSHFEYFVVFIILAISSLTLTWKNESQAQAASDAFCASAMNHLKLISEVDEIQGLQVSLLLAHYAHMNPEKADNWICISNATRIVLDLGLHREPSKVIPPEQASLRRQLFFVLYGMERSLCGILRLPLSFPEESITVKFDMSSVNRTPQTESECKALSASHIYLHRALETEVHRVLYLQEDVTQSLNKTLDQWSDDIKGRLTMWHNKAKSFAVHQMLEFQDVQYSHLLARIHRPTPRIRIRNSLDRKICLEACQMLVEDYQKKVKNRRLFYAWLGVHILFEAAVIMLDACWHSRHSPELKEHARFVSLNTLPQCLALLAKVGERWFEATLCAEHLKPVVDRVADIFEGRIDDNLFPEFQENMTEKLEQWLFPDGPLAWKAPSVNPDLTDSVNTYDREQPRFDEFQWDKEWDLSDFLYAT